MYDKLLINNNFRVVTENKQVSKTKDDAESSVWGNNVNESRLFISASETQLLSRRVCTTTTCEPVFDIKTSCSCLTACSCGGLAIVLLSG